MPHGLFRWLSITGLSLSLLACASTPQQAYQPMSGQSIKTVGLLVVPNPKQYHATDFGNPAAAFGAIGGAAAGAKAGSETEQFNKMLASAGFNFGRLMNAALAKNLRQQGYQVVSVPAKREEPHALLEDYSAVKARGVDAYLDVVSEAMGVGYASVNMLDNDFRPDVRVKVRLVDAKTHAVLYAETFMYGYHNPFMSATNLDAPKAYYVDKFEQLMWNKSKTVDGLKAGISAIAGEVGSRLQPGQG